MENTQSSSKISTYKYNYLTDYDKRTVNYPPIEDDYGDKNLLIRTLSVQTSTYYEDDMRAFVKQELEKMKIPYNEDKHGNIYATKGDAETKPCIVSHMDTVHDLVDDFALYLSGDYLFAFNQKEMVQTGIGGDDKVGIYICLACASILKDVKLAFFVEEEIGCVGSSHAIKSFFNDVSFMVQCDRKGNNDFVTSIYGTTISSDEFQVGALSIAEKYGYKEASGGLTDVYQLKEDGVNVSAINLSCGYYAPHTSEETVNIPDVMNTQKLVLDLCTSMGDTEWPYEFMGYYNKWGQYPIAKVEDTTHNVQNDMEEVEIVKDAYGAVKCPNCKEYEAYQDTAALIAGTYYCFNCHDEFRSK